MMLFLGEKGHGKIGKNHLSLDASLPFTNVCRSVKCPSNERPNCSRLRGLVVGFIVAQSHCQVFHEGTLWRSAQPARVTDIWKATSDAVQYNMPIRIEIKDSLNVFHSNNQTKCWLHSSPFFQGGLWHQSLLNHKAIGWTKHKQRLEDKWVTLGNHGLCRLIPLVVLRRHLSWTYKYLMQDNAVKSKNRATFVLEIWIYSQWSNNISQQGISLKMHEMWPWSRHQNRQQLKATPVALDTSPTVFVQVTSFIPL